MTDLSSLTHSPSSPPDSKSAWHVLLATWCGMLFDGMDASIYTLTLFPSLAELMQTNEHALVAKAGAVIIAVFLCGWAGGAVVFGIIADYFGRAQTLLVTVLFYAVFTGLCATSHSWEQLAIYRFLVGVGIGGEISVGGVMVAEAWSGKSRLHATGVLQSAFPCGFFLLAVINLLIGNLGWRYLYLVGTLPALLTIYIRLKLKDQAAAVTVRQQRAAIRKSPQQALSANQADFVRFPLLDLFSPKYRSRTLVVLALAATACTGYNSVIAWIPAWTNQMIGGAAVSERSYAMFCQNIGAIVAALTGGFVILLFGRAWAFRLAFSGALLSCAAMFLTTKTYGVAFLIWTFIVGFFVLAPFTYLFIYVPELFETRMRATAFAFSLQFGRIFAAGAALVGGQLVCLFAGSYALAGACVSTLFLIGVWASFFLPRSDGQVHTAD